MNFSVLILPNCGPDVKYFLAFMRTQLSTTTTMILVFGPKVICFQKKGFVYNFYFKFRRVLSGTGDETDDKNKRWQLNSMVISRQLVLETQ